MGKYGGEKVVKKRLGYKKSNKYQIQNFGRRKKEETMDLGEAKLKIEWW
jgi:hypothetical protein